GQLLSSRVIFDRAERPSTLHETVVPLSALRCARRTISFLQPFLAPYCIPRGPSPSRKRGSYPPTREGGRNAVARTAGPYGHALSGAAIAGARVCREPPSVRDPGPGSLAH